MTWVTAMPGPAAQWSPWIAVPVAVVLGELGPYALHRWSHRGGWAWRVHAVHHAPDQVNASNNATAHPFNVLWNPLARALSWLALGFDPVAIAWASLFIQVQSFSVRPLRHCIGNAELHRWHHSVVPGEALNFGTALPLWDQVFGTYKAPSTIGPVRVGIADLPAQAGWRAWRKLVLAPVCAGCG